MRNDFVPDESAEADFGIAWDMGTGNVLLHITLANNEQEGFVCVKRKRLKCHRLFLVCVGSG